MSNKSKDNKNSSKKNTSKKEIYDKKELKEHILFAHVTSPLVQLSSLIKCLEKYKNLLET